MNVNGPYRSRRRRWARGAHIVIWGVAAVATFLLAFNSGTRRGPSRSERSHPPRPVARVAAVIPVRTPVFIASGAGSIWVGSDGGASITRIDPSSNHVVAGPIRTGDYALGTLAASTGGALVGDGLRWLNAKTNTIGPRQSPGECGQPSAAGDASGKIWYAESDIGCGALVEFDSRTGSITNDWLFSFGSEPEVVTGDGHVWISDGRTLGRLDPQTGIRQTITRVQSGDTFAVGDGVIGVLRPYGPPSTLTRFSDHSLKKLGTTPLIEINHDVSYAIAEGDGRFWLEVDGNNPNVVAYDVHTGRLVGAPLRLHDQAPLDYTYAFGTLWIVGTGHVLRIAPTS